MNITKVRKDVMIRKSVLCTALAFVIGTTASCASKPDNHDQHVDYDRFETYNRAMFKFNYQFDKYILKPVAEGYRAVTNDFTRERVRSVISNIKEPVYAATICCKATLSNRESASPVLASTRHWVCSACLTLPKAGG